MATAGGSPRNSFRPPNRANTTPATIVLKTRLAKNTASSLYARFVSASASLTIVPYTLIGENPPACAPCTTITPISRGLIPNWTANPSAMGATIATAAGLTAPIAVRMPAIANMIHGMAPTRPPTARIAKFTSQSTVPFR